MTRFSRHVVLILGVALALLVACTGTAMAGQYTVSSCDASTMDYRSFGDDWSVGGFGDVDRPVEDCPYGLMFDNDGPAISGDMWSVWFDQQTDAILHSTGFIYFGGDTSGAYQYTVRTCRELDCPVISELEPGGSAAEPVTVDLSLSSFEISDYAIIAECVEVFCPDPPLFVAKNFTHAYVDETSPEITDLDVTPDDATGGDAGWLRGGDLKVAFSARDSGSGVAGVWVGLDGTLNESSLVECDGGEPIVVCERNRRVSKTFDLDKITEGTHFIRIVVYDRAITFPDFIDLPFRIDRTPPDEPVGLAFDPAPTSSGWTTVPVVTVGHGDPLDSENNTDASGWGSAIFDIRRDPNAAPVEIAEVDDPAGTAEFTIPEEGAWNIGARYRDGAGNTGNRAHRFIGYDIDTPQQPVADPLGWISLSALYAGVDQVWSPPPADPDLESGICGYSFKVDDDADGIPPATANVPADRNWEEIDKGVGEGHHFAHVRTVACNGNASLTETEDVMVDGTAPVPELFGPVTDAWLTSPPNFSISANDDGSGTAAIEYGFDGPSTPMLHPGSVTSVTIPQGESTLSYRAVDAVGNSSSIQQQKIRADWTPPSVEFETDEFGRPNAVTATISDSESGLSSAAMQIHRTDPSATASESAWHTIGATASLEGPKTFDLTRLVPDGELAPGTYEVRVSARDVAGNWSEEVPTKTLTLPLRGQSTLSAAIATYGKRSRVNWSGAKQDRVLRYGTRSALVGSLVDAAGNPVPDAQLTIREIPEFGVERDFGVASTDASGEFVVKLPVGPTRTYAVQFEGTDRLQPATETASLRSRAALTLALKHRTVRSGRAPSFTGRLLSGALGTPEGGKIVQIEWLFKRGWRSYATVRVDSRGRFKYTAPTGITARKATYVYFHVTAKRDGRWPFLTGSSKPVKLRVLPPK